MLKKHKVALFRLLERIKFKFSKDSSDCLSTFSTTLEFLRLLVDIDLPMARTITLTNQELREVVAWTQDGMSHPLVDLQKSLEVGRTSRSIQLFTMIYVRILILWLKCLSVVFTLLKLLGKK